MFSYISLEQRVRADHPLRAIRTMTDRVFAELSPRFGRSRLAVAVRAGCFAQRAQVDRAPRYGTLPPVMSMPPGSPGTIAR